MPQSGMIDSGGLLTLMWELVNRMTGWSWKNLTWVILNRGKAIYRPTNLWFLIIISGLTILSYLPTWRMEPIWILRISPPMAAMAGISWMNLWRTIISIMQNCLLHRRRHQILWLLIWPLQISHSQMQKLKFHGQLLTTVIYQPATATGLMQYILQMS